MSDAIIVAIISGLLTLGGTVITVWAANRKTTQAYMTSQAVIEERVKNLADEVRKHNGFAERIPALEARVSAINDRVKHLENK